MVVDHHPFCVRQESDAVRGARGASGRSLALDRGAQSYGVRGRPVERSFAGCVGTVPMPNDSAVGYPSEGVAPYGPADVYAVRLSQASQRLLGRYELRRPVTDKTDTRYE